MTSTLLVAVLVCMAVDPAVPPRRFKYQGVTVRRSKRHGTPGVSVLLGVTLLSMAALAQAGAAADEKPEENTVGPFTGTVVDPAGKPVARAKVWLCGGGYFLEEIGQIPRPVDVKVLAESSTDEKGRFQLAEVKWNGRLEWAGSPTLTARDAEGRIGGRMPYLIKNSARKRAQELEIRLQAVRDFHGRLVDVSGQPIAAARIQPHTCVYQQHLFTDTPGCLFAFPPPLSEEMAAETGTDGTFTIRGVPVEGEACFVIGADGFGKPVARLNMARLSTSIQLGRTGDIQGSVVCAEAPEAASGIRIRINLNPRRTIRNIECETSYSADVIAQRDGTFRFDSVPPGTYALQPEIQDALPYYIEELARAEVKSGETTKIALTLKPAIKVQGKVVDQRAGEGVGGIGVRAALYRQRSGCRTTTTRADGTFVLYAQPGRGSIGLGDVPDQFSRLRQSRQIQFQEDTALEPFVLERRSALEGIVVDTVGSPVSDAGIWVYGREVFCPDHFFNPIHSDAAGKFVIQTTPVKHVLNIRARTRSAAAEPVDVVVGESEAPIRLVVDEKVSFALRGIVVNDAGQPVPAAEVMPTVGLWFGTHGPIFRCEPSHTDADGRFEIRGLWRDAKFDVCVSATGYDRCGSRQVEGTPGGAHDFGKITLVDTTGTVEGTVVDRSDKPLAGARVFNSGDGLRPMETQSNDAGHFRLEGFRKGPVFIFAEKEGYRFTGVRTTTGATDVILRLLPGGELGSQSPTILGTAPSDEEKNLARDLQEKLLAAQAKVAPAKRMLSAVAEEDLEEAFSTVGGQGPQAYRSLKGLADYFALSNPAKAMRCAEEAVVRARTVDEPERTVRLAEMGALVGRLGNREAGEKLAREAANVASKWAPGEHIIEVGAVAAGVAAYDLSLATNLLDKISDPRWRSRRGAEVAAAAGDIEKAESLLRDLEAFDRDAACRTRVRLALRIAPSRPAEAVRLIEDMPGLRAIDDEGDKALVFGQLAVVIAPRNPAMAYSLIDRAFAVFLHPADRTLGYDGGRATRAALTAVQAQKIGYPDVDCLIYRVLATRPATADVWTQSPVAAQESMVVMATFLAMIEPSTAKQVLQTIEPNGDAIGSSWGGARRGDWFRAWALADPRHAAELAERELASAKDQQAARTAQNAVREMMNLWTAGSNERLRYLSSDLLRRVFPDEEY